MRVGIVGGGIVGVAVAHELARRHPHFAISLWEKESQLAQHQTGRNSGVIHSGIYYLPGSMKARTCLEGRRLLQEFCDAQGLAWEGCGKVIVATQADELERLERLWERGLAHGLRVTRLTPAALREIEPHCQGIAALHVPETGIVDYRAVTEKLAALCHQRGVHIHLNARVRGLEQGWRVHTAGGSFPVDLLINCGGLYSDHLVKLSGRQPGAAIIPFRGEYFELSSQARGLCRNLIYPVPDPRFPFLGVHFTRGVNGHVEAGPNAVLALGRENYRKWDIHWGEAWETVTHPGFRKLARRFWKVGAQEMLRSFSKRLFHRALQRLVPELRLEHLEPGGAGIRAQAVDSQGNLVDDFLIQQEAGIIHVINAPSPAATASLAIARHIADRV